MKNSPSTTSSPESPPESSRNSPLTIEEILALSAAATTECGKVIMALGAAAEQATLQFAEVGAAIANTLYDSLSWFWHVPRPPLSFMEYYDKQSARRRRKRKHRRP
jgi:hypothetical protein